MKNLKLLLILLINVIYFIRSEAHSPTWTNGIACIVYSHCTSCHNPSGIAPFSLLTYNDVYQNRYSIAASVQARSMPPFPPSQQKQKYAHANTLSEHEINELVDWVNNFAPLGDANMVPPAPIYESVFEMNNPDQIIQIPKYEVNTTDDIYRCFVLPLNNIQQKFIEQIEVIPGNRDIVHHALIFQDTSSLPLKLDMADSLPGYNAFGGTGSPSSKLITGYTPGQGLFRYPSGFGSKISPNSYIIIQIHYPGNVSFKTDSTQIRIKYGKDNLRNISTSSILNHSSTLINGPLSIPANVEKTFYNKFYVKENATITGIMPHMHLLGKSIKSYMVTPQGDTSVLIDIPQWDFHWQGFYEFQKPIFIPGGSTLYGEALFDNTSKNINNPNNPPKTVNVGEGTDDEMFLIYFNYTSFQATDTLVIIDTASHYKHYNACVDVINSLKKQGFESCSIFPNPAKDYVEIKNEYHSIDLNIFSSTGQLIINHCVNKNMPIYIGNLNSGIYYFQIKTPDNQTIYKKFVKD